jgi:hypothetical protein
MPDPLPSDIVARLRSDSTTALAPSLILAGSFPDIVSWALRAFSLKTAVGRCDALAVCDFSRLGCISLARGGAVGGGGGR